MIAKLYTPLMSKFCKEGKTLLYIIIIIYECCVTLRTDTLLYINVIMYCTCLKDIPQTFGIS